MSTGSKIFHAILNFQISSKLNDEIGFDSMKNLQLGHLGAFDIGFERA